MTEWVLLGLAGLGFFLFGGALAYYVYRNPIKLAGLGAALFKSVWPYIKASVLKRMTPEEEAKWRKEYLTGVKKKDGLGVTTTQPAKTKDTKKWQ